MKKYGLITDKRKPVPLKEVDIAVKVSGFIAHVQADLHYENKEDEDCEAKFSFPLDDGSAVYKFEAVIKGRHIGAECQEKEEARQTYDDALVSGQTAMLLEEDENSSDLFCCTVGNLPAKTVVKLTLAYVLELPAVSDGKLRFTIPVVLNPRYSPNLDHMIGAKGTTRVCHSDIPYTFNFSAAVSGKQPVKYVTSGQGDVAMEISDDNLSAKVSLKDDFKFDDDARFLIEYEDGYQTQCVVEEGGMDASIGSGTSTSLVNGVARAGSGKAEFIGDTERIQPKVMSLLRFAMQPSVTNLDIVWELPPGVSDITMPQTPPSLFRGDRLIVYALMQGTKANMASMSGKVYINGRKDKGPINCSANFFHDKSVSNERSRLLRRLAAKAQIKLLYDKEEHSKDNSVKTKIIILSKASNIVSRHPSFVAVDKDRKERVKTGQSQRKSKAMHGFDGMSSQIMQLLSSPL